MNYVFGLHFKGGNEKIAYYGLGNAGFSWSFLTGDLDYYDSAFAFAYGFGGGIIIDNMFNVGLRYFSNKSKFKDETSFVEQSIGTLQITLGVEF